MSFDPEYHIDVTGVDVKALLKAAYELSRPQGLGHLHYRPEPLTDADADEIIARGRPHMPFTTDYVHGRAMKLSVYHDDGRLFIKNSWYDHSAFDLEQLLKAVGLEEKGKEVKQVDRTRD